VIEFGGDNKRGGCYAFCKKGQRGSFPVWVIEFERLECICDNEGMED